MRKTILFTAALLSSALWAQQPALVQPTPQIQQATSTTLAPSGPLLAAKSWILLDNNSGQVLASQTPDSRVEPASITKLMVAYLAFEALKTGKIKLDQSVPVSASSVAAGRGDVSKMFLEVNKSATVDELLHGMIIQSGNDATVLISELLGGTEGQFANLMNEKAKGLGLVDTHYTNAAGMPDPQHYTTAQDVAKLASALIRDFPEYYPIYSQKEFTYNKIKQPNRNRLLTLDPTVDGMKTGHTKSAGFCLVSSALRGPRRLISVVMGTESDAIRAQESLKLLNYGFQAYDAVQLYDANQAISQFKVWKGAANEVKVGFLKPMVISVPKGMGDKVKADLESKQPLVAPLEKGATVGTLKLSLNGQPIGNYPVLTQEAVPVAGWFGRTWDGLSMWMKGL